MTDPSSRPRLGFLDGVRGAAALYVLFHHAYFQVVLDTHSAPLAAPYLSFLAYGPTAVIVFIVLSGFCLMLPVVNSNDGRPRGGWQEYFIRRAIRIVPPYWCALALVLLFICMIPALQHSQGRAWDTAVPALLPGPILAHILLLQDFQAPYFVRIDPPMWSVAVEWHIYFLFPLLLLLWRRFGVVAMVAAGVVMGYLPHKLSHGVLDFAKFHYIGLFTIGIAACWIAVSVQPIAARIRSSVPWGWVCAVLGGICCYTVPRDFGNLSHFGLPDYIPGAASAALLIYLAGSSRMDTTRGSALVRFMEHPWLRKSGTISYSLYLIHYPLLAAAYAAIQPHVLSASSRLAILFCLTCPTIIALSVLFYRCIEKRFMPSRKSEVTPR